MINQEQVRDLIGSQVVDSSGEKVGKIGQVFLDDQSGQPEWATVSTGLFGTNESFVPLAEAELRGDEIRVPYAKSMIKDAPNVDLDVGHLDESQERELYSYYGLTTVGAAGHEVPTSGKAKGGQDTSGPPTDDAMTRSEERLRAGTEEVPTGTARLRKWVETEEQQLTVPVTKEKARLETEPITDANRDQALDGPSISEEEHEVTLTEERPVVAKETVPVERVRLTKDVEQDEAQVSEEVRKERISAEGEVDPTTGKGRTGKGRGR